MSLDPRHKSRTLLDGRDRAPARSYLKAIGFGDADLARPIVGIANTWTETMPCNFNLRRLAEHVKRGVREAGGTPMRSEEHTSELQSHSDLVCRLLLEKKKKKKKVTTTREKQGTKNTAERQSIPN